MRPSVIRSFRPLLLLAATTAFLGVTTVNAAPVVYTCLLGPELVGATGSGFAIVTIDAVAHTMHIHAEFSGLSGNTTASHIHGPTAVAGTGNAGVMTTTPSFVGFPLGVTAGIFDNTLDMTLASSYNPSFLNNATNLGSTANAEASLFQAIASNKAYLNIHSSTFPGGEIRGYPIQGGPTPTAATSWGSIKQLSR